MIAKLGGIKPGDPLPDHPAFGVLIAQGLRRAAGAAHRTSLPAVRALSDRALAGIRRESVSFIDASAPVSSSRERHVQKRM